MHTLFGPDGPTDFQIVLPRTSRGSEPTKEVLEKPENAKVKKLTKGWVVVAADVALEIVKLNE